MPTKKDKSHVNIRDMGGDDYKATYHDSKGKPTKTTTGHISGKADYVKRGATDVSHIPTGKPPRGATYNRGANPLTRQTPKGKKK